MNVTQLAQAKAVLTRRTQVGANWFLYIAGLSVINSIIFLLHQNIQFVVGLGTTQVINYLSKGDILGIVLGVIVAGIFALFGVFARKGQIWAFWVGMVLYLLDGLLILVVKDWLAIAFHAYALYCLFAGAQAAQKLKTVEKQEAQQAAMAYGSPSSPGVWPPPPTGSV